MKQLNGHHLIQLFEQFSPKKLAVDGDRIGLQVGTLNKPIKKVMIALDVLEEVVDEAIATNVDIIIAHHPLIFRPLKNINTDKAHGRMIEKLLTHEVTVYAAHTNLDVATGGVNDLLADALELTETDVLVPTKQIPHKKLFVFVPEEDADNVRNALGDAGAGAIGNYTHCSYLSHGTGSFRPGDGSNPHIGEQGKQEFVDEVKIECIFPETIENQVLQAMLRAHPYEEVAYDLYKLENDSGEQLGLGRIGYLENEMTLQQFAEHVKQSLLVNNVRVTGNLNDKVRKVAVLGGDGNKYMMNAVRHGADVYVTGDVYYHVAHDAMMTGLNIVDPGHNVEKIMKDGVKRILNQKLNKKGLEHVEVITSEINTDPFQFV